MLFQPSWSLSWIISGLVLKYLVLTTKSHAFQFGPSSQPSSQPSSRPSSYPTTIANFVDSKVITANSSSSSLSIEFDNIGVNTTAYISVVLYISWLEYSSGGFVQVVAGSAQNSLLICSNECAPMVSCSVSTTLCAVNMDVSAYISNENGGSLQISTFSNTSTVTILPTTCTFEGSSDIEYVLTITLSGSTVPTPQPTVSPTPMVVFVIAYVSNVSATVYFIIGICMVIYAAVATIVVKVRSKHDRIVAVKLIEACADFVVLGSQMITEIFYVVYLFQRKRQVFDALALTILFSRFINIPSASYFLISIFRSESGAIFYDGMLDRKHLRKEIRVYVLVVALMMLDVGLVKYLPWNKSDATESKLGYPYESMRLVCMVTRIVHSTMAVIVQGIVFEHFSSVSSKSSAEYGVFVLYIMATVAGIVIVVIQGMTMRCHDLVLRLSYFYGVDEVKEEVEACREEDPTKTQKQLEGNILNPLCSEAHDATTGKQGIKDIHMIGIPANGNPRGHEDEESGRGQPGRGEHFVGLVPLPAASRGSRGGSGTDDNDNDGDGVTIAMIGTPEGTARPRSLKMNESFREF